jgi:hypothetical protein
MNQFLEDNNTIIQKVKKVIKVIKVKKVIKEIEDIEDIEDSITNIQKINLEKYIKPLFICHKNDCITCKDKKCLYF